MAYQDFTDGLTSFNDYISPTVNNTTSLLGDSNLIGVQAEYSYNLKDMICALLAGQGLLLPNFQLCLTVALDELLKNPLQGALKDSLQSLRDGMDAFNDHTGIDNVLKNLNGIISEVGAVGSMINFCADPVNPKSIPNMIEGMFGSFLGKGLNIMDAIGQIGPDNMCGCVGLDGNFNFSSLNSGALKDINDNLASILDGSFAQGSLDNLVSTLGSIGDDLEELISLEGLLNGAYSNGGSSLHGGECSSQFGLPRSVGVGTSFSGGVKDATSTAGNLSYAFDKLGGYPVKADNGTEYNNIFEVLVEPEMLDLLKKGNNYQATVSTTKPIYDYCGNVTGYSTTTKTGGTQEASGQAVVTQTAPGASGSVASDTAAGGEETGGSTTPGGGGGGGTGGGGGGTTTSTTAHVIVVASAEGLANLTVLEGALAIREDEQVLYAYFNNTWYSVGTIPTTWLDNFKGSTGTGFIARGGDTPYYRTIIGTANKITVTNGDGTIGNPTINIPDNPILTGTSGLVLPSGTTAQATGSMDGTIRWNSETSSLEFRSTDHKVITHSFATDTTAGAFSLIKSNVSGGVTLKTLKQGTGADLLDMGDYISVPSGAVWTLTQVQNAGGQVYTATFTSTGSSGEEVLFNSLQIGPGTDKAWYFDVRFIGRQAGGTLQNAFKVEGVADNTGGTLSIIGTNAKTTYQNSATHWDANIVADVSTNKLKVSVYGETGQNVNWSVFFKLLEA